MSKTFSYRDDAVYQYGIAKSWRRGYEYDVITTPVPRSVHCYVTLQSLAVVDKLREFTVSDEFRQECLGANQFSHLATVGHIDAEQNRHRIQHVWTDKLQNAMNSFVSWLHAVMFYVM